MLEEKIKHLIIEKYGSVRSFAFKANIPYTTIDSILRRGIDNSNVRNVIRICKKLNISLDKTLEANDIISNLNFDNAKTIDISKNVMRIPIYGSIKAGIPLESQTDIVEYINLPITDKEKNKKFFGIRISGDSMFPNYIDGDTVIFEQNDDIEQFKNKDVAVMINHTESTFKKILINDQGIVLVPYNQNYDMMMYSKEEVEQLPIKVIGIARKKITEIE